MCWAEKLVLRFRSLFSRTRVEQELDDELRFHLEQQIEENLADGMTLEAARHKARRTIGGIAQVREECRDMRGLNMVDNAVQDFRRLPSLQPSPSRRCWPATSQNAG